MITYLLLIIGFFLLIKGADFFVDGSSSIAKILRVPSIIIGLTIVAFGTSHAGGLRQYNGCPPGEK